MVWKSPLARNARTVSKPIPVLAPVTTARFVPRGSFVDDDAADATTPTRGRCDARVVVIIIIIIIGIE